jgi:hypothetical protein
VRKILACTAVFAGLTAAAHAADSVKDAIPDGPITWMGVTFYGTIETSDSVEI